MCNINKLRSVGKTFGREFLAAVAKWRRREARLSWEGDVGGEVTMLWWWGWEGMVRLWAGHVVLCLVLNWILWEWVIVPAMIGWAIVVGNSVGWCEHWMHGASVESS